MHPFFRGSISSSQLDVAGLAVKVNDLVLRVARRLRRTQLRQPARVGGRRVAGGRAAAHAHREAVGVAVSPDDERKIMIMIFGLEK